MNTSQVTRTCEARFFIHTSIQSACALHTPGSRGMTEIETGKKGEAGDVDIKEEED